MFVLVACEESQAVCIEFRKKGHFAFSCDLQRSFGGFPEFHICCDVTKILPTQRCMPISFITEDSKRHVIPCWDLIIAHPPCTMLSKVSSANYSMGIHTDNDIHRAREFFMQFYNLQFEFPNIRICIENPVPFKLVQLPPFTQTIQPYEYGDNFTKLTCLWLYNLPPLIAQCYGCSFGNSRCSAPSWTSLHRSAKQRSKTFKGIARAMALQWQF